MREIINPSGETYLKVEVRDDKLTLHLKTGYVVVLDAKVIPQLRQILAEAEFLKYI